MDFRNAPVAKNIMIITFLLWLLAEVLRRAGVMDLDDLLALHIYGASDFHWYQLVTFMFLHGNFSHVLFNILAVLWCGMLLEYGWGSRKFLFYYIFCGIGAAFTYMLSEYIYYMYILGLANTDTVMLTTGGTIPVQYYVQYYLNGVTTCGASGCVYGMLLAFGLHCPEREILIFPVPFPVKAKWMVVGYAAFELVTGMKTTVGDNVAHFAHLGGMLFGLLMILYWRKYGDYRLPLGLEPLINENCPKERNIFYKLKNIFSDREKKDFKVHTNKTYSERKEQPHARPKRDPEIDAILKKVRESGYDSLTTEEKRKLFNGY
jgi:membrane associated rhomboid family serine protease